jgi:hypothetical protein
MATFFDIFRSGYEHRLRNGGGANTFQNVSGSPLSELEVTPDLEDQISFEFWKRAADEYETARDEAHWAKAFAISEGDDAKTKATYIRIRAITLFRLAEEDRKSNDTFIQKPEPVHVIPRRSSEFFVATIALAILVIAVATIWLIVDSRKSKSGQEFSSVAGNTMPNTSTAVSGKTGSVCRVYWDGFQIRPEKNNMRGYAEYRLEFYGNEIRLALPKELATELHGTLAPGDSPNFNAFFNSIEQQIISACGISF